MTEDNRWLIERSITADEDLEQWERKSFFSMKKVNHGERQAVSKKVKAHNKKLSRLAKKSKKAQRKG